MSYDRAEKFQLVRGEAQTGRAALRFECRHDHAKVLELYIIYIQIQLYICLVSWYSCSCTNCMENRGDNSPGLSCGLRGSHKRFNSAHANGSTRLTPPWKRRLEIIRCEIGITNVRTKLIKPPLPVNPYPPNSGCLSNKELITRRGPGLRGR